MWNSGCLWHKYSQASQLLYSENLPVYQLMKFLLLSDIVMTRSVSSPWSNVIESWNINRWHKCYRPLFLSTTSGLAIRPFQMWQHLKPDHRIGHYSHESILTKTHSEVFIENYRFIGNFRNFVFASATRILPTLKAAVLFLI